MSTHKIEILTIQDICPHNNADSLEITHVFGWQCVIKKDSLKIGDKIIYIPPDFCVPLDRPEFAFLQKDNKKTHRITVKRLRGQISQGLIIPVPKELDHLEVGTNVIDHFGIVRYEPPLPLRSGGLFVSGPSGLYTPKFDIENYQRYKHIIQPNEEVVISEKIHGTSARFVFAEDKNGVEQQFCGTRTNWISDDNDNYWWTAFRRNPCIGEWCKNNKNKVLYGECYGQVQVMKYGANRNDVFFAAFAIMNQQSFMDYDDFSQSCQQYNVKTAPVLYRGPFNEQKMYELAEQDSVIENANHLSEGVVVLPVKERYNEEIGRVCLKCVSNRYLERH